MNGQTITIHNSYLSQQKQLWQEKQNVLRAMIQGKLDDSAAQSALSDIKHEQNSLARENGEFVYVW